MLRRLNKILHRTYPLNRNRLTNTENRLGVAEGEGEGSRMDGEFGVSRCKLLHVEWMDHKVLQYFTGNCVQSLNRDHDGKYKKKEWISKEVLLYSTGNYIQLLGIEHDGR